MPGHPSQCLSDILTPVSVFNGQDTCTNVHWTFDTHLDIHLESRVIPECSSDVQTVSEQLKDIKTCILRFGHLNTCPNTYWTSEALKCTCVCIHIHGSTFMYGHLLRLSVHIQIPTCALVKTSKNLSIHSLDVITPVQIVSRHLFRYSPDIYTISRHLSDIHTPIWIIQTFAHMFCLTSIQPTRYMVSWLNVSSTSRHLWWYLSNVQKCNKLRHLP